MASKVIKLRKLYLESIFDYSKYLLPIFTDQQFSLDPPSFYENPYNDEVQNEKEIKINPITTHYFSIPEKNQEFFLMGVMHNNQSSAIEVYDFLNEIKPDSVVLEIDDNRNQLFEKNYEKFKPKKIMETMARNKHSLKLMFKKKLEYIVAKEKIMEIKDKKVEIISGDQDYYLYFNNLRHAQTLCKCSFGLKELGAQIWRAFYFLGYLLSMFLRRLAFIKVPINQHLFNISTNLAVTEPNCIMNKAHYQRDFQMFKNIISKSYGNRIFVIVGLYHTRNLTKLMALYQKACSENSEKLGEIDNVNYKELPSVEDLIKREYLNLEMDKYILDYVDFYKDKVYCNGSVNNSNEYR